MTEQMATPDRNTPRTMPNVPYHMAQSLSALNTSTGNALSPMVAAAQVHAQLAIADAIERQTSVLAGILDHMRNGSDPEDRR